MKTKLVYVADDDSIFEDEKDCLKYEKFINDKEAIREEINTFFKDVNNYDYIVPGHWYACYCSSIGDDFRLVILESEGNKVLYENFNVDYNKMEAFEKELEERYSMKPLYPAYYWGQ